MPSTAHAFDLLPPAFGDAHAPVGVLGGMGPLATVDFMHKLWAATPARRDQDHLPLLVSSIPQVPDRTAAYLGKGESPLPALIASGRRLVEGGAALVVMPCNTAHLWFDPLQAALGVPMLHLVDAALAEAVEVVRAAPLGLLATEATLASGLYTARAPQVDWRLPTAAQISECVSPGIAAIKAGDLALGRTCLRAVACALVERGARALVLGCTEIPLVLDAASAPVPLIDATAALARRTVAWAAGRARSQAGGRPAAC
ncbi:aspartate/glutamate racemase family protein [Xenophilus aerolatus]|nr:amino acid racemase [Xenophilus aerolatus]